ncbi:secreted frizzled-related protein 3-like [Physella acuta]|uniref:secreted frizzled-related protein 3-like n=1 Tax=Physella acuta TaxID=109671 RepID=UPI0027DBAEE1|nr:secreted frizzled-related protein 3-like [Physella acuta]
MSSFQYRVIPALLVILFISHARAFVTRIEQCEPIEIPRCRAMPYNMTQMPNLMHHNTQENARLVFEKFEILLDQKCSDVLLFLLCSIYVPICAVSLQPDAIPPCRSVCEKARAGCEPLMNSFNVSWPDSLDCARLPRYERGVCVTPEAFVKPTPKKKSCKACKKKKPSWPLLRKNKYDYAIRILVLKAKRSTNQEMIYRVKILHVIFGGNVRFPANNEVTVWVNSTCSCPKLHRGKEYLVLDHQHGMASKLLLTKMATVTKWKDSMAANIKDWQARLSIKDDPNKKKNKNKGGKKRNKAEATVSSSKKIAQDKSPAKPEPSRYLEQSPFANVSDFLDGYTHGGRYYTKELAKKYSQALLRAAKL